VLAVPVDDIEGSLASDDGRLFVAHDRNFGTSTMIELTGTTVRTHSIHRTARISLPTIPGPDGRLLYGRHGIIDTGGNLVSRPGNDREVWTTYLPCANPRYFLGIAAPIWVPNNSAGRQRIAHGVSLIVLAAGSQSPLFTVIPLDEMDELFPIPGHLQDMGLVLRQCVQWIPSAELLVTLPREKDRLFLRRLSASRATAEVGGGPLHVASPRSLLVPAGKPLSHRIEVQSGRGKLRFTLNRGPAGLTLSPDGLVEWAVPVRGGAFDETAVLTIEDGSGNSLFHRLDIHVR
jgi:hypothetical protein